MNRPVWSWLVLVPCWAYLAGMAAILALLFVGVREPPPLALLGAFMPLLFAPAVLALLVGLALRSRAILAGSLALLAVFAFIYGPLFWPRQTPSQTRAGDGIKVMTFNLGPGRATAEGIISAIEREKPDVVAVQEAMPETSGQIIAGLASQYPYMLLTPETMGTGLLSRFPIVESQWLPPTRGGRAPLYARLDWRGERLNVIAAHSLPPDITWLGDTPIPIGLLNGDQQYQMAETAQWIKTLQGMTVLMGDLNQTDQSNGYIELSKVLWDAFREAGQGFGFTFPVGLTAGRWPVPGPLVRLDYIFYSPGLDAREAHTGCNTGSDHCYVLALLVPAPAN